MRTKPRLICVLALFLFLPNLLYSNQKIAMFRGSSHTGFWPIVETYAQAAAGDLGIKLEIYEFSRNPVKLVATVEEVLSDSHTRPDCILFYNYKKRGIEILKLAEKFQTPAFLFNAGFKKTDSVGKPRRKYKYWIGQMIPDDEFAGYLLASKLISLAKKLGKFDKAGRINLIALEGNRASEASNSRVRGLKKAVSENPIVLVKQYFHSKWKEDFAFEAFERAIIRHTFYHHI